MKVQGKFKCSWVKILHKKRMSAFDIRFNFASKPAFWLTDLKSLLHTKWYRKYTWSSDTENEISSRDWTKISEQKPGMQWRCSCTLRVQAKNSHELVQVKVCKGYCNSSLCRSAIVWRRFRTVCRISSISGESIDVVAGDAIDVDGIEVDTVGGVNDALTVNGRTNLPTALISLCTDERLLRVVDIVTLD